MRGGEQTINLAPACFWSGIGVTAHEILHSLGMWHEQSRCDRDNFITVNWENIGYGQGSQFEKKCPSDGWFWQQGGVDILPYSEGSLMHYDTVAFSWNGAPTITSNRGLNHLMGQRVGLHQTDATTINTIYQPYAPQGMEVSYPGGVPTVSWNAKNGATLYHVSIVVVYEEYDDYNGTSSIWDYMTDWVGNTSELSLQDTQRTHTGTHQCMLWSSINGSASYNYYYELGAYFSDGTTGQVRRWPAQVAPASC